MRWRPERGWTLLLVRLVALVGSLVFLGWSASSTTAVLSPGARPSQTVRDVDEGSPADERRLVDLLEQRAREDAARDSAPAGVSADLGTQDETGADDDSGRGGAGDGGSGAEADDGDEGDEGDEGAER